MKSLKDKEQAALAAVRKADADEAYRGFCWGLLSVEYKRRALSLARLDQARAIAPLSDFSPYERGLIAMAASACATQMELISQVANAVSPIHAPKDCTEPAPPKPARSQRPARGMTH